MRKGNTVFTGEGLTLLAAVTHSFWRFLPLKPAAVQKLLILLERYFQGLGEIERGKHPKGWRDCVKTPRQKITSFKTFSGEALVAWPKRWTECSARSAHKACCAAKSVHARLCRDSIGVYGCHRREESEVVIVDGSRHMRALRYIGSLELEPVVACTSGVLALLSDGLLAVCVEQTEQSHRRVRVHRRVSSAYLLVAQLGLECCTCATEQSRSTEKESGTGQWRIVSRAPREHHLSAQSQGGVMPVEVQ